MASSHPISAPANIATSSNPRDRPWLLPSNRKLRNVISISLRNLNVESTSSTRRRGKTIDDDALPQTLRSPAKIVAQREHRALEHSRSSSDLRAVAEEAVIDEDDVTHQANGSPIKASKTHGGGHTPKRPSIGRMRRRSTLEWANATPQRRQERLESVTAERMADAFFSLHAQGVEEPIYISETVSKTMNPTFRNIDFFPCGPGVTRLDHVTVRVWVKSVKSAQWKQLLAQELVLQSLQYLGKSLDQHHLPLPQNAMILHLTDGIYTPFTSLVDFIPHPSAPTARTASARVLPTASFDALLRLAKLDDSIQDALATRNRLAADLEALFEKNKESLLEKDQVAEAADRLKTIEYAKTTVSKQVEKARKQQEEKRASLETRRKLMTEDLRERETQAYSMHDSRPGLLSTRNERSIKKTAIQNQRRRICEDLQFCYPITPVPKKSLSFTIRSLHLPNADTLDDEPPDTVAAALGHVAHVVLLLSYYLRQPLPYPVDPRGSTSTISDPISLLKTSASTTQNYKDEKSLRTYPLFSKGVPRFRYEYAAFLLNKDIQLLLETVYGIRTIDIRQTLPNLKYLLYVATAGEGELPARKAGGVRGLLRAKQGTPDLSRAGSMDSNASSTLAGSVWSGRPGSKGKGAVESLRGNIGGGKTGY